jgi:hypothetical protein
MRIVKCYKFLVYEKADGRQAFTKCTYPWNEKKPIQYNWKHKRKKKEWPKDSVNILEHINRHYFILKAILMGKSGGQQRQQENNQTISIQRIHLSTNWFITHKNRLINKKTVADFVHAPANEKMKN